jgi:hypothetical protein
MTSRQLRTARRAAERIERKRQAMSQANPECQPVQFESGLQNTRLIANRANAQLSTGPRTPEGKAKSSLNAVKTGLTGRTVLLPTDDVEVYQQHVARYSETYKPEGDREKELTQSLADIQWRLNRIPVLEMGIYAMGHREFATQFESEDPSLRKALIETQTFLAYQRQLNNLSIQESRLRRQYDKDLAELIRLQQDRAKKKQALAALDKDAKPSGFEFSTEAVKAASPPIQNPFGNQSPQSVLFGAPYELI